MPQERFSLHDKKSEIKNSIDSVLFAPLEKLRVKWENADLDSSILFTPLSRLKGKIKENTGTSYTDYQLRNDDELINAESALGRTLFGVIPAGHQREFFRDKKNIWIFHESWTELDQDKSITIRYEVREDGVYKKIQGAGYVKLEGLELETFAETLRSYLKLCKQNLYGV